MTKREILVGCLRSFYHNRHKFKPGVGKSKQNQDETAPVYNDYYGAARMYIRKIRALDNLTSNEQTATSPVPNADNKLPNADNKLLNADDKMLNADNKLPNADDKMPNADGKLPNADDKLPPRCHLPKQMSNSVPNADDKLPEGLVPRPLASHPGIPDVPGLGKASSAPTHKAPPLYVGQGKHGFGFKLLGDVNLPRFLRIIRRKWFTILAACVFAVGIALIYLALTTKIYRASSMIEMSVRRPRISGQPGAVISDDVPYQSEEIFNTRVEKFRGNILRDTAQKRFALFAAAASRPDGVKPEFAGGVTFTLLRRSRLLRIAAEHTDPASAMFTANAYAEAAEMWAIEENKTESDNAVQWLQTQAHTQGKALERAEQTLRDFRANIQIDALETAKRSADDAIVKFNQNLIEAERQEITARELTKSLGTIDLRPENFGQLPASMPNREEIAALVDKWRAAQAEHEALLVKYTPKHPDVIALQKTAETLQQQCIKAVQDIRASTLSSHQLLLQQLNGLRERIASQSETATRLEIDIVEKKSQLSTLERERDASDIAYRGILNRIEEARLSADENTAMVRLVERAMSAQLVRPRKMSILTLAISLGLLGGFILAMITDTLEDRIIGIYDLESILGLKMLSVIPHVDKKERADLAKACMNEKFGQFVEVFAGLRALLDSPQNRDLSHSLLVVSTNESEGKTITASNLAIVLARSGQRTLLIDFDLRRPRLGQIYQMPETTDSLIHALHAGDPAAFPRLPFSAGYANLEVVASRATSEFSPAEIMGSPIVKEFIKWARGNYDRVIVDAPPFGVVGDALALAHLVGSVIMICRPHRSRRRTILYTIDQLQETGANILGVILTDVDFNKGLDRYFNYYDHYTYYGLQHMEAGHKATSKPSEGN